MDQGEEEPKKAAGQQAPERPHSEEPLELTSVEKLVGSLKDITPKERMRLTLAYALLTGVAVILLLSGAAVIWAPEGREEQAQALFDFAKSFGPPIVTLVIGFYFRGDQDND